MQKAASGNGDIPQVGKGREVAAYTTCRMTRDDVQKGEKQKEPTLKNPSNVFTPLW